MTNASPNAAPLANAAPAVALDTPPPHWPEIKDLFDRANAATTATARELALAQAPPHLRAQVESLLAHLDQGQDQLESPAWDIASDADPHRHATASKTRTLPPGTRIGQFTLREPLGHGGMGAVYRADQSTPQRTVAVKVLSTPIPSPRNLRRFAHEGQSLARFKHPSIVSVIEMGQAALQHGAPPSPYLAMDLVAGKPMLDAVGDWPMDRAGTRRRIDLLARVADAIEHAHQRGVWHRDLKSSNILVDDADAPHVLDFGVAALSERDDDEYHQPALDSVAPGFQSGGSNSVAPGFQPGEQSGSSPPPLASHQPGNQSRPDTLAPSPFTAASVTEHRHLVGTYSTMAPELLLRGQVSHHADIYALGLLAWEAITGAWPFSTNPISDAQASPHAPTPLSLAHQGEVISSSPPFAPPPVLTTAPTPLIPHSLESALRLAHNREQNQIPLPTPTPTTLRALRQSLGRTAAGDLLLILRKALAFEPSARYASAAALASDLQRVNSHEPISLRPRTPGYLLNRFARRRPAFAATIAAAITTTLATSSIATWQAIRANRASTLAAERLRRTTDMIATITKDLHKSLETVPESKAARVEILRLATETAQWMAQDAHDVNSLTRLAESFIAIAGKEGAKSGSAIGNLEKGRQLMDDAIAMLRRAIEIDPRAPYPRWILGRALIDRAQFEPALDDERRWRAEGVAAFRQALALSPMALGSDDERNRACTFAFSLTGLAQRTFEPTEAERLMDEADAIIHRCLAGEPDNIEFLIERVLQKRVRAETLLLTDPARAIDLARAARAEFQALLPRSAYTDTPLTHIAQCGSVAAQGLAMLHRLNEADLEFQAAHGWIMTACREQPSHARCHSVAWDVTNEATLTWIAQASRADASPAERAACLTRARQALAQAREVHSMRIRVMMPGTYLDAAQKFLVEQDKALAELEARLPK